MGKVCGIYELTDLTRQAFEALFVSEAKIHIAFSKKPRAEQSDNNFKQQLYDGEVISLQCVNRALQAVNTALEKLKKVEILIDSTER